VRARSTSAPATPLDSMRLRSLPPQRARDYPRATALAFTSLFAMDLSFPYPQPFLFERP
jgi:hypothetical protein